MRIVNPVIFGDYSDPDAIRVGDEYFMISSSFTSTPVIPILHSTDLTRWEIIGHVADNLPFEKYNNVEHGCGAWAPALRYHDGVFYCFVPLPDEGIFVYRTCDIYSKWEGPICIDPVPGHIDPCPLWDEDGRVYMVYAYAKSRTGFNSRLHVCQLDKDITCITDEGRDVFDGSLTQPTIEGPKFYKRNGYYYIFAPAGGVTEGWQTVLRARDIFGPYEEKIVLETMDTEINGPHQGALVDTPLGEEVFIHFRDMGVAGRIIYMEPVVWENDWPVMGDQGKPVREFSIYGDPDKRKYDRGISNPGINESELIRNGYVSPVWQWNANHQSAWAQVTDDQLCLSVVDGSKRKGKDAMLINLPNLLLQKTVAENFSVGVHFDLTRMQLGDECGLVVAGDRYAAIAVRKKEKSFSLIIKSGNRIEEKEIETVAYDMGEIRSVGLRSDFFGSEVRLSWAVIGDFFAGIPGSFEISAGRWVGARFGLYSINFSKETTGKTVVQSLKVEKKK